MNALRDFEELLGAQDTSSAPFEMRLDIKKFPNIRIAGWQHLPLDQQFIIWAAAKGWVAFVVPSEVVVVGILAVIKPKQ